MGRYVRAVVSDLAARPALALTLLVRDPLNATAYREIAGNVDIAPLSAARRSAVDTVWYPWNGMRFTSRAPSVVTINDDFAFAYPAPGRVARWREQQPIRRAVKDATHILTISTWARRTIIERFALEPQRISIIPLAPQATFSPGDETSPYAEPFVLAVGVREERKNIAFLIDAFARAFPDDDVRLVLVGTLDERLRRRAQIAALRLTEVAPVDDHALRRLYRTAAAVAVPSLAEGFGLVAAEAQACGAAVVAADAGALPEAVGSAGILRDPRDTGAWVEALREVVLNDVVNADYRTRALARWPPASRERTADAIFAALQRTVNDSM